MTAMQAAALYAGLSLILLLALAAPVSAIRRRLQQSWGAGEHKELDRAIRAHGNTTEYLPAFMVGLVALAAVGAPAWAIHVLGAPFLAGRVLYAWGVRTQAGAGSGRLVGTGVAWLGFLIGGGGLIYYAVA